MWKEAYRLSAKGFPDMKNEECLRLAAAVREACLKAALDAYEDSGAMGLCVEGRWEAAISAVQRLDLERVAATLPEPESKPLP